MGTSRVVRIPVRHTPVGGTLAEPSDANSPAFIEPAPGRFEPNRSGTARGMRTLLVFLGATLLVYAAFLGLFLSSPTPGVRDNPLALGFFSAFGALVLVVAYSITLHTAPKGIRRDGEFLVVTERIGRERRYRSDPSILRPLILKRYGAGPLNDAPVVLLQLSQPDGARRAYLLDEGLIEGAAPP